MEFPQLGQHCSEQSCKQLDFLPMKCDSCEKIFCKDHFLYLHHNCAAAYKKDVQVPLCPICDRPIPVKKGELPDIKVGEHIDRDCKSLPSDKKKIYVNKCSFRGCKQKEMLKILCDSCRQNYCLKHRHVQDHQCSGRPVTYATRTTTKNSTGSTVQSTVAALQGSIDEDEAFARALQLSLNEAASSRTERTTSPIATRPHQQRRNRDPACNVS